MELQMPTQRQFVGLTPREGGVFDKVGAATATATATAGVSHYWHLQLPAIR